eukprot:s4004_g5.t1
MEQPEDVSLHGTPQRQHWQSYLCQCHCFRSRPTGNRRGEPQRKQLFRARRRPRRSPAGPGHKRRLHQLFEFSPPGRGSLLRDSSFAARIDVGSAGAAGACDTSEAAFEFPSLLGQCFDVHLTLFYRWLDQTVGTAIDVVSITGTFMFAEQLNYQNQPDSSGRFALATYFGLVASPAVLTVPSPTGVCLR